MGKFHIAEKMWPGEVKNMKQKLLKPLKTPLYQFQELTHK